MISSVRRQNAAGRFSRQQFGSSRPRVAWDPAWL